DVDVRPRADTGLVERVRGDPRVLLRILEGVQHAVHAHPAQQADAAVAAERPDLDCLERADGARDHLQVQPVEPADRDGGQPFANAALADLAQDGVLGAEHFLGPARERGVALTESLVLRRARHGATVLRSPADFCRAEPALSWA